MKLRAFIGSSKESLNIAYAIKENPSELDVTVWDVEFFSLGNTTLPNLASKLGDFDLAVFVFADDDDITVRNKDYLATRDNVIFEYGLFTGHLGARRCFVVRAQSKNLHWLSDLDGLAVARYDQELAKSKAADAVRDACANIRFELQAMVPRPGVYIDSQWKALHHDWWTHGHSTQSNIVVDGEGIELSVNDGKESKLRFPRSDNLNASERYCVFRIKATRGDVESRFYVTLSNGSEKKFLFLSDIHTKEGWASRDEFKLAVPRLDVGSFKTFLLDLDKLKPYIGDSFKIQGVRIGTGLKLSHFCACDNEPLWVHGVSPLIPHNAPLITIEQPAPHQSVPKRCFVKGTLTHPQKPHATPSDIQVLVFSPDNRWYPQGYLKLAKGEWEVEVTVGDDHSAGLDFAIGAITVDDKPVSGTIAELPVALGNH
jgi:hypothetical protein